MRVKDLLGVALIAMTVSAAGAGVVFFRTSQRLDLDSSFCPKTGPAGWSTIIIDRTDPLQPSEQEMVRKLVEEERKSLPRAAKLTVVVLREEKSRNKVEATTLMALCNPGADNQVSVLFENTRKAALR
jgi:hypothetical protein